MVMLNNLAGTRIGNGRIELVSLIGEGSYGCVYHGILHNGDKRKTCAVKCMSQTGLDAYHLMIQRREILLHQKVSDGPGIVTLYEAFEEGDRTFAVMEYCPDGDLWEATAAGRYYENHKLIRETFAQILDAVAYCHARRVFHRDLKPENIFLAEGGRKVLLGDFGLASGSVLSYEMRCGSPWYMSPECWGMRGPGQPYATGPNDVWALGVLLINLACGRHAPWRQANNRDLFFSDFIQRPRMLRALLPLAPATHDLLARVFVADHTTRISVADFASAVRGIERFTLPPAERAAFRVGQQAAWSALVGRTALVIDTLRLGPAASSSSYNASSSASFHTSFAEGIDITDAGGPHYAPFVVGDASTSPPPSTSFICDVPIAQVAPRATSEDSEGPITPDMPPTAMALAVPDIADGSQDLSDALDDFVVVEAGHVEDKAAITVNPLHNIVRGIRAL